METLEFLSAVLIVSEHPAELAAFYRDVVGIPLKGESHGDSLPHFGCTLGDLHFAIHPVETFPDRRQGVGAVKLAFTVFDIHALVERLEKKGLRFSIRRATPDFSGARRSTIPTATLSSSRSYAMTGSRCSRSAGRPTSMWSRDGKLRKGAYHNEGNRENARRFRRRNYRYADQETRSR